MRYLARDFVETSEGWLFAVVANGTEGTADSTSGERVPTFLRYVRESGRWRKVATGRAREIISGRQPDYLFHSDLRDVDLHGIPPSRIVRHYQPRRRAAELARSGPRDPIEGKAIRTLEMFRGRGLRSAVLGVTGSLLVGSHSGGSDIDLVVYDRESFHRARAIVGELIETGTVEPPGSRFWTTAYARREGSLTFGEYVWHERRKRNKFAVDGTKVDISMVDPRARETIRWRKVETAEIRANVVDDAGAFDYPARLRIDHPRIPEVVSYTNTYTGQAFTGEGIEARGWIERSDEAAFRLLVGTSREARGEFIKVFRS